MMSDHRFTQVELVSSAERCGPVDSVEGVGEVAVGVERADGGKCGRCWNYSDQVCTRYARSQLFRAIMLLLAPDSAAPLRSPTFTVLSASLPRYGASPTVHLESSHVHVSCKYALPATVAHSLLLCG